jgi:site-specific recombinase XerD
MSRIDEFLYYCQHKRNNKDRERPLPDRTIARYRRGLTLASKLIGHDLEEVSVDDQLVFMRRIKEYAQGTRRVTTVILHRYIHWCKAQGYYSCENLIEPNITDIVGEDSPVKYKYVSKKQANLFFKAIPETLQGERLLLQVMYYGGLTSPEVYAVQTEAVTQDNLLVYRERTKKAQLITLPIRIQHELYEYAQNIQSKELFPTTNRESAQGVMKRCATQSGLLKGYTANDLRISGIREFFESSGGDIELTRIYAGAPKNKMGWFVNLLDEDSHEVNKAVARRKRDRRAKAK